MMIWGWYQISVVVARAKRDPLWKYYSHARRRAIIRPLLDVKVVWVGYRNGGDGYAIAVK